MEIIKEDVGNRIRAIREKLNYSMNDFGTLIDSKKSTVNSWERGLAIPKEEMLKKIALLGKISIDELLYGKPLDYLKNLFALHFPNYQLIDKDFKNMYKEIELRGFTYHDDLKLIQIMNDYLEKVSSEIETEPIFYLRTNIEHTFITISRYLKMIEYFIYADVHENTIHVMPFTFEPIDLSIFIKSITEQVEVAKAFNEHLPDINISLKEPIKVVTYDFNKNKNGIRYRFLIFDEQIGRYKELFTGAEVKPLFGEHLKVNLSFQKEIAKEVWYHANNIGQQLLSMPNEIDVLVGYKHTEHFDR